MGRRLFLLAGLLLIGLHATAAVALPFAIGHRQITFVDPARGNRQIQTELYYPADEAGDNVPVAAGTFPVITFGHGFLMVWSAYGYFWDAFAPRGYILAFPRTEGGIFPSHEEFGRDLAFLVDELQAEGNDTSSPFYNHVAPTSCVMGHSMGGGASVLAASYNPGITALANLAAAETSPSAIAAAALVTAPTLMFAGSEDCVTPPSQHQIPIYNALSSSCKTLVTLTGGSHCQFADSDFYCELGETCTADITRQQQHELTESFLAPWLDWTLKGDGSGLQTFQGLLGEGQGITYLQDCAAVSEIAALDVEPSIGIRPFPNPFVGQTSLLVALPRAANLRIDIIDASGRRVRELLTDWLPAGLHARHWDGRDADGRRAPGGVYYCRIRSDAGSAGCSLILLR